MSGSVGAQQMSPAQQNANARTLIYKNAKPIFQRVTSRTFLNVAAGNNVFAINPLQIGFLRRFVVRATATFTNGTGGTATLTPNGADNLLSNITFSDFTGNPRHNCSGRSLSYVEAFKYQRTPGASIDTDSVSGFGSIVASNVAPATIAASGTGTVTRVFEIPIMVDTGMFMAGGMWLGVNNQSTLLTLTINPSAMIASGDPLTAVYTGSAGTITSITLDVYQDYWNNVPVNAKTGAPVLPLQDVGTAYLITETASGITFAANQAGSWNYPTFSQLLGTYFTYDNNGVLNPGTDLASIALVVSNYSIIKQYHPQTLDRITRDIIGTSMPQGSYGIASRQHPLSVSQYPSLQLQITPSAVTAGATALITTELLRQVQYLSAASGVGGS